MPTAVELLRQGRHEDIWQMCCGYLKMDIEQFMAVQKRLLLGQIELLNNSRIGRKMFGTNPVHSIEEFREQVPLTTYIDYLPELSEKREEALPDKPELWVHTSGRSGEYSCKWIPITSTFADELGPILCGIGMIAASRKWGDNTPLIEYPTMMYTVAPRPYISGALADILRKQTPSHYYPSIAIAENMSFEDRIKLGFNEALDGGIDFFFGLSLVLNTVGHKFSQSSGDINILPLMRHPKALMRLTQGKIKSKLAGRAMLPKDIWKVKGIVTSGLDSSVYRENINEYWGRYPLDIYANTEGGVIATQTWDYENMTFIPNLNFLEFIPEKEHLKWQLDHKYQPKTLLLNEVRAGECYEIVISNFHGGSMIRYRVGDIIRINSLSNEKSGVRIPQMTFERRADDLMDFVVIRLSEKTIWKALEKTKISYSGWVAYKSQGEPVLNILLEPDTYDGINPDKMERDIYEQIIQSDRDNYTTSATHDDLANMIKFNLKLTLLPRGSFANFTKQQIAEGADVAHLKPPHVNPSVKIISMLTENLGTARTPNIPLIPDNKALPI